MIKFDDVLFYQFGFYAPGSRLEPEPKIIAELLKAFDGTNFVPTTISEMRLGPVAETRQQLHLVTKNSEWSIEFEPHRISFIKKHIADTEIGSPENFAKDIFDFCSRLSAVVSLTGNRLSYVTKGLLPEMNADNLVQVGSKLLTLPKFYVENLPTEWTTRNVTRYKMFVNGTPEIVNVITDINRIQGVRREKTAAKEFDCIEIGFDINTFQKNMKQRFQFSDSQAFIQEATTISQRLLGEIEEVIL